MLPPCVSPWPCAQSKEAFLPFPHSVDAQFRSTTSFSPHLLPFIMCDSLIREKSPVDLPDQDPRT